MKMKQHNNLLKEQEVGKKDAASIANNSAFTGEFKPKMNFFRFTFKTIQRAGAHCQLTQFRNLDFYY